MYLETLTSAKSGHLPLVYVGEEVSIILALVSMLPFLVCVCAPPQVSPFFAGTAGMSPNHQLKGVCRTWQFGGNERTTLKNNVGVPKPTWFWVLGQSRLLPVTSGTSLWEDRSSGAQFSPSLTLCLVIWHVLISVYMRGDHNRNTYDGPRLDRVNFKKNFACESKA